MCWLAPDLTAACVVFLILTLAGLWGYVAVVRARTRLPKFTSVLQEASQKGQGQTQKSQTGNEKAPKSKGKRKQVAVDGGCMQKVLPVTIVPSVVSARADVATADAGMKVEGVKVELQKITSSSGCNSDLAEQGDPARQVPQKNCEEKEEVKERTDMDLNEHDTESTPLHSLLNRKSSKSEKLDLLYTFLTTESDVDMDQPDQSGNTPLHLAIQREDDVTVIKMLLAFGAEVNPLNNARKTPLGVYLEKCTSSCKEVEVTLEDTLIADLLTSYGAKYGSDTPQECAIKPFVQITQMEKGEDFSEQKDSCQPKDDWCIKLSKTYYEIHKCFRKLLDDNIGLSLADNFDTAAAVGLQLREVRLLQMAGSRMLFLDGGGMKGLMQIDILCQIEKRTGRKITELFDWIVGTSVGAVIAMGLVHGKQSLQQLRQLFHGAKDDVFGRSWYSMTSATEAWTKIFQDLVGNMTMDEVKYPRVLATGAYKKTENLKLHFFSNDPMIDPHCRERLVWKVCRYTSAAPLYFEELDDYVDGGVLANNPAASGLTEIQTAYQKLGCKLPISMIVSISCGQLPDTVLGSTDVRQLLFPGTHWFSLIPTLVDRVSNLFSLLGNAVTESEDVSDNVRARCIEEGIHYCRFSPTFEEVISLGETDRDKLIDMVITAHTHTNTKEQLDHLMALLPEAANANWEMCQRVN